MYKTYTNPFYNPTDTTPKPGDNQNWEDIQRGFYRVKEKIEEGGSGNGVTIITATDFSNADASRGIEITNYDKVKDIIGHFRNPQYVIFNVFGLSADDKVFVPCHSVSGGGADKTVYTCTYLEGDNMHTAFLTINEIEDQSGVEHVSVTLVTK